MDADKLLVYVTNPKKMQSTDAAERAAAQTQVDLGALFRGDYRAACEKGCLLCCKGLCVHVCAALKHKGVDPVDHLRPCETIAGLRKQLWAGGADGTLQLPSASKVLQKSELLESTGSLLPLVMPPLRPQTNKIGRLSRKEDNLRQKSAKELASGAAEKDSLDEVQKAIDPDGGKNKGGKGVKRKCSFCKKEGHMYRNRLGKLTCPEAQKEVLTTSRKPAADVNASA